MFLKGKPLDEYKGFSYRLVKIAIEKGIEDTRELADALYENAECKKTITIRKTQKKNLVQVKGGETDVVMIGNLDVKGLQDRRNEYNQQLNNTINNCINYII